MKTATLRDLRYDFSKIEAWLRSGEEVQITKRSKPFCRMLPESSASSAGSLPPHPDYKSRLRDIWGDRVFTQAEVEDMRTLETGEP
jgi:antitoxin (DNA-binding transcriptional repressor) of toxin-antitoxin stability system